MRVLHILGELKPSGAEVMYLCAADLWRGEGLECQILSDGDTIGVLAPKLAEAGYRIHQIPFRRSAKHVVAVYKFLRKQRYDVVHVNGESACFWYSLAAYLAGTRSLFRTVHNVFPFRGLLRLRRRVQRSIMRHMGVQMIAVSTSVQRCEAECFHNRTHLIPTWFNDHLFVAPSLATRQAARRQFALPADAMVITSVAGCGPAKNHEAILHAVAQIAAGVPLVYLHVGQEDAARSDRRLAATLGIIDRVRFLGVLPPNRIVDVLHASDAFVMPSRWEGLACSAIEALGAGTPAILSDVPGLRDFAAVVPEIRWIEPAAESLASAIRELYALGPERRYKIGASLSAAAHREFGRSKGALQYLKMYKSSGRFSAAAVERQ
jgi:glycosyltransferase involved in cell wall biosynthesis